MINLNDLTLDELTEVLLNAGEPKFRAKQIFKWFSRGVTNLDEMTDISAKTKEKIKENSESKKDCAL